MSSESRRLAWWQWMLIALVLLVIVTLVLTQTLRPGGTEFM